jgi:hypothetical protein
MDLQETLAMLCLHALQRDHFEKTKAISHANMLSTNQTIVENDYDKRMVNLCKMHTTGSCWCVYVLVACSLPFSVGAAEGASLAMDRRA